MISGQATTEAGRGNISCVVSDNPLILIERGRRGVAPTTNERYRIMINRKITATDMDDARNIVAIPKREVEAIGRLIHALRLQVETLEDIAKQSGIDTWVDTNKVTTLADEIIKVK